ncbi:aspartate--tRNA ligase [Candidatus Woesearchaeota archaeon]|nr:aspartate--tRNA ligase [Candidatus Woesearchaeota archaeon]
MLRSHTCGELNEKYVGKKVELAGWVSKIRTHGGILFVDIRDRHGITQLIFDPHHKKIQESAMLSKDDVIKIAGRTRKRLEVNRKIPTGKIEVLVCRLEILNKAAALPMDENAEEDTRLKYRYIDLRSAKMQKNIILRHKIVSAVRSYFDKNGFLDIETPVLGKSTPEGARDYLVPSRVHKGKFYALPQSPQLYKQLLMVSGMDKYYQIVKCFRDEDLRSDRQPEFTQIDVEMSFVEEEDIYQTVEGLMKSIMKAAGANIKTPFRRITYREAMAKYGSDKPDLRFGMELVDITDIAKKTEFKIFNSAASIKCIVAEGCASYSRKQIDRLADVVKIYGARGLAYIKLGEEEGISKFVDEEFIKGLTKITKAKKGDLVLFVADAKHHIVDVALGQLRLRLGRELKLIKDSWEFAWIVDFPMFEYDEDEKRHVAVHHPFTSPKELSLEYLKKDPHSLLAKAYDLVLNGNELGGGSIRIHRRDVQERVFELLGIPKKEAELKFGFLLEAFKYGAPPHGGIAFGLDRLVAILAGEDNIREVITFPKTKSAESLMEGSPSKVNPEQLDELGLKLAK